MNDVQKKQTPLEAAQEAVDFYVPHFRARMNSSQRDKALEKYISPRLKEVFRMEKTGKYIWSRDIDKKIQQIFAIYYFPSKYLGVVEWGIHLTFIPYIHYTALDQVVLKYKKNPIYSVGYLKKEHPDNKIGVGFTTIEATKFLIKFNSNDIESSCTKVLETTIPYAKSYFGNRRNIKEIVELLEPDKEILSESNFMNLNTVDIIHRIGTSRFLYIMIFIYAQLGNGQRASEYLTNWVYKSYDYGRRLENSNEEELRVKKNCAHAISSEINKKYQLKLKWEK
ncbi:MAG: hypothetical protein PHS44_07235 [Candidatus Dojkabacteria bacterium]|nr:hypothetical protein [Candidatus Dojkabacteria bacterium]